ncbi:hypothetical protein B0H10DRAFT_1984376 [Mycena sp. CBHHK59/15]|nr:hypothetical protein B0H10DRAFT_1984376 [Mycena sp. CBHHK59/15]
MLARDVGPAVDVYQLKILFLEIIAEAVSYGVFFTVAMMSTYSLVQRGIRGSLPRQCLLAITMVMVLAATAHLGLHIPFIMLQLPVLVNDAAKPTEMLQRLDAAQTGLRRLVYFLSDVVVVWRAWAIWSDNLLVICFLAVSLFATFVTSVILYSFNINKIFHNHPYTSFTENFLGTFGLLVTNFGATALIGYKVWYYRRNLKRYINRGNSATKVESVLILLLESGGIYCAFWVLVMVGDFGYFQDFGFEWFQPNISGIYPTIVILVVSHQKMLSDDIFTYTGGNSTPTLGLNTHLQSQSHSRPWMSPSRSRTSSGHETPDAEDMYIGIALGSVSDAPHALASRKTEPDLMLGTS